ncbi:MAG: LLM class flavin-dependent oxidoreductase [Ilumatobacter sp.]|nr:LLM class flavin-dependent oxidoreductase [Ilumatobacter sp.]
MSSDDERPSAMQLPLSQTQRGMLFESLLASETGVNVEQVVCTLREPVAVEALAESWRQVLARHWTLRTSVVWEGVDEPSQIVHDDVEVTIDVVDRSGDADDGADDGADLLTVFLRDDRTRGIDLSAPPLMRWTLIRLGDDDHRLVWTFYHGLLDGRAFAIVLREVFALYDATRRGETIAFDELPSYERYLDWQRTRQASEAAARAHDFWARELAGLTEPTSVPFVRDSGATVGHEIVEQEIRLSTECTDALGALASAASATLSTVLHAAWALVLGRYTGERDLLVGSVRSGRPNTVEGAESMVGVFINSIPVRARIRPDARLGEWLSELRAQQLRVRPFETTPFADIIAASDFTAGTTPFESLLIFDRMPLDLQVRGEHGDDSGREFRLVDNTGFPLTLRGYAHGSTDGEMLLALAYDRQRFEDATIERMLGHLRCALEAMAEGPDRALAEIPILSDAERDRLVHGFNRTDREAALDRCVHDLLREQARRTPDAVALAHLDDQATYRELDERSEQIAHHLRELGVRDQARVGICVERSVEMVVALCGILKAGGAYVPLDPEFPAERLAFMAEDAGVTVLICEERTAALLPDIGVPVVRLDRDAAEISRQPSEPVESGASPDDLAYVIYTSGSTGKPKGVMIEHRNVASFFAGMDDRIGVEGGRVWLAVTSLSFDISVLEIFWTLTRGFKVVLFSDVVDRRAAVTGASSSARHVDFSLYYFASGGGDDDGDDPQRRYELLLEGAKFADAHGFSALWTPERHFHPFGGIYPSPPVVSAAVAAITERLQIRAGSVVLPLNDPIRVAEQWSVVDGLSKGRVGISFASGWQPNDFVLSPDNYADRKEGMFREIETVRALWRGEPVRRVDGSGAEIEVRVFPRPIQEELPVWVTAAGSPETFQRAGEIGANVLTHLLGQTIEEIREKIELYREARADAGHDPSTGCVTLMLHTFVSDDLDRVRDVARDPLKSYLSSAYSLVRRAAWSWPMLSQHARDEGEQLDAALDELSDDDRDALLEHAFDRYFETSGLFGTPESCQELIDRVKEIGVDEISCLIDFGIDRDAVLESLPHLARVREIAADRTAHAAQASARAVGESESAAELESRYSIPALIDRHEVTHLQCTPSMARMLLLDPGFRNSIARLECLLLGGEALPATVVDDVLSLTSARLVNMYGPTETTIWSSTHELTSIENGVAIGTPIANTQIYVLDPDLEPVPVGVAGEIWIGGEGVARGYHERPELTAERFVRDPFGNDPGRRIYRTGDLGRFREDGVLDFLGRVDFQVKIRGHRIELGEIEAALAARATVREAVVVAHEDTPDDVRLVGYLVAAERADVDVDLLRTDLAAQLPDYMVPSVLVELEEFPLTPNKKIDRKALPAPGDARVTVDADYEAPADEFEDRLASIWQDVLHIERVGAQQNFFDLGGHSINVVQVHAKIRDQLGVEVPLTDLFRYPTVRTLAQSFRTSGAEPVPSGGQRGQTRAAARKQAQSRRRRRRG